MDYLFQQKNDIRTESIEGYISNETYLKGRVGDILSHTAGKQWLSNGNKKLLDIGCGVGWSLVVAKMHGFRACGVEPVAEAARYANESLKLDVINSLFKSSLFTEQEFDFIIMDQVLEHVPNPVPVLVDAFRLLKPGGIFFLSVPPVDWSRRLASISLQLPGSILGKIENGRPFRKFAELARKYDTFCYPEGHINYFSAAAISLLARKCNAQVLEQYHVQKIRGVCFPMLKLSTGSFFLRKN